MFGTVRESFKFTMEPSRKKNRHVAADETELKGATAIRDKEAAAFADKEKELKEVIDVLQRAVAVLEKEMGGAKLSNLEQAIDAMVRASAISTADASKLSSFVQAQGSDEDTGALQARFTKARAVALLTSSMASFRC